MKIGNQTANDLYDDDQNGDVGLSAGLGGASVGLSIDTDPAADMPPSSYSAGYNMSGIARSLAGTDADHNGDLAMVCSASYQMVISFWD